MPRHLLLRLFSILGLSLGHGNDPPSPFGSISYNSFWGDTKVDKLTTVGFESTRSLDEQMDNAVKFVQNPDTEVMESCTPGYKMLHLPTECGAELWGGANADDTFFGYDPHFAGRSRLKMNLLERREQDHDECVFVGMAEEFLQFDFYCPTYHLCGRNANLPVKCMVQICAFALDVQIFDSLQNFEKHNDEEMAKGSIGFADKSFGAMSIFSETDEEKERDQCKVMITGHIVESERKINERTGQAFYWILVETLGGCHFDVVVHPIILERAGNPPKPGSIIQGMFYLSGRLLPGEYQRAMMK